MERSNTSTNHLIMENLNILINKLVAVDSILLPKKPK